MNLSEAEREIMDYIWLCGSAVSAAELVAAFADSHGWKIQTVSTFLARLAEKGALIREKRGGQNRYSPAVSREAYQSGRARRFLEEEYGGSVRKLVAALYSSQGLSKGEIDELREWLEQEGNP